MRARFFWWFALLAFVAETALWVALPCDASQRGKYSVLTVDCTIILPDNAITGGKVQNLPGGRVDDNTLPVAKILHEGVPSPDTFLRGDGRWSATTKVGLASFAGLQMGTVADNQSVSVTANKVMATDNQDVPRILSSVSLTIDLKVSGANGLDNGSLAANTGYYLYVIDNGTTTRGLASTSATAPTMPSGYTYKALIGWCTTDNTATPFNIKEFTQIDDAYSWNAKQKVVTAGGTTTTAAINLAAGGALPYAVVPASITKGVFGRVSQAGTSTFFFYNPVAFSNSADESNAGVEGMVGLNGNAGNSDIFSIWALQESQKFYFQVSGQSVNVYISGFTLKR